MFTHSSLEFPTISHGESMGISLHHTIHVHLLQTLIQAQNVNPQTVSSILAGNFGLENLPASGSLYLNVVTLPQQW